MATDITVSSTTVNSSTSYPGSTCTLRIYSSTTFTASDGTTVMSGTPGTGAFLKSVACTISSGVITIPSFTLPGTTGTLDNSNSRYSAVFYDSRGVKRDTFLADFPLPASMGTTVTWAQIRVNKSGTRPLRDTSVSTRFQTDAQIQSAPGTLSNARFVYVSKFGGADIGARINAADASCGANPCTIYVDVQGNISTPVSISANHSATLWFGLGDWTTSTGPTPAINSQGGNARIKGSGWGTRIHESSVQAPFSFLIADYQPAGTVGKNLNISDLQIIGTGTPGDGAHSLINLGNCLHCSVRNVFFNSVGPIGVQIGNSSLVAASLNVTAASNTNPIVITTSTAHGYETGEETTIAAVGGNTNANGKFIVKVVDATRFSIPVAGNAPYTSGGTAKRNAHAIDVTVSGCSFLKVAVVNVALVNGKNIHIDNNTFRAVGNIASGNSSFIDLEPNSSSDWLSDFTISNNTFDGRQNIYFSTAIQIYGKSLGVAVLQKSGIVSGNVIKGPTLSRGVTCADCTNVLITGNRISTTSQPAISLEPCTGCRVTNNEILNTGSAGNQAIVASGTLCDVSNNRIRVSDGGSSTNIDVSRSAGNTFINNVGATYINSSSTTLIRDNNGITFARLPAGKNGSEIYCTDCTIANPCAGGGTGARAKYLNGVKVCN